MAIDQELLARIERDGFALVPQVFRGDQVEAVIAGLTRSLSDSDEEAASVRSQKGSVYAARNVLALYPPAATLGREPPLPELLAAILGRRYGLVRALYFDKPPERTWSLPWHKDMTVAVRDNSLPSQLFTKPTRKAGVAHVEAPRLVLDAMLTVRIHLDDVREENGPVRVLPGSHREGKPMSSTATAPVTICCDRGDVLLMRPLVAHCSAASTPGTRRHRRIMHLEFAAMDELPDGYRWHTFLAAEPTRLE